MALDSENDLSAFHQFVAGQLLEPGDVRTPEECLEMWRLMHPRPDELTASTESVCQAFANMQAGDKGRVAREILLEARQKYTQGG